MGERVAVASSVLEVCPCLKLGITLVPDQKSSVTRPSTHPLAVMVRRPTCKSCTSPLQKIADPGWDSLLFDLIVMYVHFVTQILLCPLVA